ncbi:hypothetical protein RZS28_03440 [Methylocapsa polymorpha]|uniref:Uncharacterized protein n=1 Tax=Methylocapsa polymorpha TaxID=3080828 RepID=A0ABZ0HU66_9HYPH|nr:hypothetical protein RZS28_03440 [Methylocapsa sp. RX1]
MGIAGEDDSPRPDRKDAAARKTAERERLAEALRANLSRRKAQNRDRARQAAQGELTQNDAAAKQK